MIHLHTYLYLERNGFVQVSLDSPGNVYLMKDAEYKKYLNGGEFECVGGMVRARKKVINAPKEGKWHLVIDNNNRRESLNVALNITNGRQISGDEIQEKTSVQKQRKNSSKEKKSVVSDKEHQKVLRKEISNKLKEIDVEGLEFLINQAKILIHKQEIDNINSEIDQYNNDYVIHAKTKKKKAGSDKEINNDDYVIHAKTKKKKTGSDKVLIEIEKQSENTFILVLCGARKILSRQELRIIVKMCHAPVSDAEFAAQLYEWLKIRRNDILFDARIRRADHPIWPNLRRFLRNRYKAKK